VSAELLVDKLRPECARSVTQESSFSNDESIGQLNQAFQSIHNVKAAPLALPHTDTFSALHQITSLPATSLTPSLRCRLSDGDDTSLGSRLSELACDVKVQGRRSAHDDGVRFRLQVAVASLNEAKLRMFMQRPVRL
jgi:hypothetical protein